jgi:hypothetical protein
MSTELSKRTDAMYSMVDGEITNFTVDQIDHALDFVEFVTLNSIAVKIIPLTNGTFKIEREQNKTWIWSEGGLRMHIYVMKDYFFDEHERQVISDIHILTHEKKFSDLEWSQMVSECRVYNHHILSAHKTMNKLKEQFGFNIVPIAVI